MSFQPLDESERYGACEDAGDNMVTYSDMFQFTLVIVSIIGLVIKVYNHNHA